MKRISLFVEESLVSFFFINIITLIIYRIQNSYTRVKCMWYALPSKQTPVLYRMKCFLNKHLKIITISTEVSAVKTNFREGKKPCFILHSSASLNRLLIGVLVMATACHFRLVSGGGDSREIF